MFGNVEGWVFSVVLVVAVWISLLLRSGPTAALGATMVLSFLFPVWPKIVVSGIPINVRTTVAVVNLLFFALNPRRFHPRGKILRPLTLLDFCVALICVTHIVSDCFTTGFSLVLPLRAYGEWVLPYVAGRYAVSSRADLKGIATWVVGGLLFLGLMSCFESLTNINPFELIFGPRPTELAPRNAARWGLKRAFGPTTHPIFLGMMITILMPWLACLWQSFESRRTRGLAVLVGVFALAGTALTGSRTPVLTVLASSILVLALRMRILRWPLGISLGLAISFFAAFPNEVTTKVSEWTGGVEKDRLIEVDGRAVITSSSRTRIHVFRVYSEALIKAGPFGYGSDVTSGFPLRIPNMEGSFKSANLFKTVDNGYILLTLRFGWVGGIFLVILFLTAIGTGFSLYSSEQDKLFPGAVACTLVVVACFSLLLVFMHYDFGFPLLWTFGILSGLASLRTSERS
jgi:hypothetical protein